jgi:hypothetical protein
MFEDELAKVMKKLNEMFDDAVNDENAISVLK